MPKDIAPAASPGEIMTLLKWNEQGLVPAITQDRDTGDVLMMAYVDRDALQKTLDTQIATYYSRSRKGLWVKGETSGWLQRVLEVRTDCDGDVLLYVVQAPGPACHQNRRSCFSHRVDPDGSVHTDRPVIV